MSSIAVLDDRPEERETIVRLIGTLLPQGWDCIEAPLLQNRSDYIGWMMSHDVRVLLVDQVLGDQPPNGEPALDYKGHGVVESIRRVWPNFPVYIFTSQEDDDLPAHLGEAEDVIVRKELRERIDVLVPRMVRSGQRFHEEHERQLQTLSTLATKVATGTASDEEKEELKQMQISMGTPAAASISMGREGALAGAEEQVTQLEKLIEEIETLVKRQKEMRWKRVASERVQPATGKYSDWKTSIANDCSQQCVYCAISESAYGGIDNFHIDHLRPRSLFQDLEHIITNLFLTCAICNRFKSDDWPGEHSADHSRPSYPDPSAYDYNDLFTINLNTYAISGQFPATTYLTEKLYLNRPQLLIERRSSFLTERLVKLEESMRRLLELLKNVDFPEANELLKRLLAGMVDLLQLKREADTAPTLRTERCTSPQIAFIQMQGLGSHGSTTQSNAGSECVHLENYQFQSDVVG